MITHENVNKMYDYVNSAEYAYKHSKHLKYTKEEGKKTKKNLLNWLWGSNGDTKHKPTSTIYAK